MAAALGSARARLHLRDMADQDEDADIRAAALHRGLRLVKSRRRKPGGDFGLYGLRTASGEDVIGIGADGLTATRAEIEAHLRRAAQAGWAGSVDATSSPTGSRKAPAAAAGPKRATRPRKAPPPAPAPAPSPPPPAAPLVLRDARSGDARAIADLLGVHASAGQTHSIVGPRGKETMLVAERGGVIGVAAVHVVPVFGSPPIGRITTLLVAERARRQGIGRALMVEAAARLKALGCDEIEIMSEIAVKNANAFLRATGFRETSYRFTRR